MGAQMQRGAYSRVCGASTAKRPAALGYAGAGPALGSEPLQLPRLLPERFRQLLGIAFLLGIAADWLLFIGFLLPGKRPRPRHLQPRFEVARRNHCATVDPSEVGDLAVRRDHGAVRAILLRQPLHHRIGLLSLFGIDDLKTLAPFGPLYRVPGTPAVKDDRHGMALTLPIAGQVPDQLFPPGFHVTPQAASHPKQVVAVDDEMDRHGR